MGIFSYTFLRGAFYGISLYLARLSDSQEEGMEGSGEQDVWPPAPSLVSIHFPR